MNDIKSLQITVSEIKGVTLLCESHIVSFGPGGLLKVPERLGYAGDDLLCFPTEEEANDIGNLGAPFSSVCDIFKLGLVPSVSRILLSAGFVITEQMTGVVWIRCDPSKKIGTKNSIVVSSSLPDPPNEECSSEGARHHLNPMVRHRMKALCEEVCPRDLDGHMLGDRTVCGESRPPWCLAKIMHDLRQEFDEKDLMSVETKAIRFMSTNARVYKRLKNLTEQDWANMRLADRKRQEALKTEMERSSESWKNSPYGLCWQTQGMRRQPTNEELLVLSERQFDGKTTSAPTSK